MERQTEIGIDECDADRNRIERRPEMKRIVETRRSGSGNSQLSNRRPADAYSQREAYARALIVMVAL